MKYRGYTNTTEYGAPCERWDATGSSDPELQVAHNFCLNPRGKRKKPWCIADKQVQLCNIPKCGKSHEKLTLLQRFSGCVA